MANKTVDAVTPEDLENGDLEEAKSLHEQRKSKYNNRRAKPRAQMPQSMSYTHSTALATPGKSHQQAIGGKLNSLISRLTRQTESSGRKNRNQVQQNELFTKPATTYQNMYYKPYSAVKPYRKSM